MPGFSLTPSYDLSAPIDLSLFAHIVNEAFASGGYKLEGNRFSRTAHYMRNYFNQLKSKKDLPREFLALKKNIQYLEDISCRMEHMKPITDDLAQAKVELRTLVNQIVHDQLMSLREGESVLLPGGWSTQGGSHAMIYEFKSTKEGFTFYIYNSGAGLSYHEKKSTPTHDLYCPVMAYVIPKPVNLEKLAVFIDDLIYPRMIQLHPKESIHFDEAILYEEIFPRISYLNAQLIKMLDQVPHALTPPQLSNTCANQCLYKLLLTLFNTTEDFERFIYRYQRYALDDFVQVVTRENVVDHVAVQNQMAHAIKTLMRTISKPSLFEKEWVEKEYLILKAYHSQFYQKEIPDVRLVHHSALGSPMVMKFTLPNTPNVLRPQRQSLLFHSRLEKIVVKPIFGGSGLITQIKELQQTCEQLKKNGQHHEIIYALEMTWCELPLPSAPDQYKTRLMFYSGIHAFNQLEFYRAVIALQEIYLASYKALYGEIVLPKMLVMGVSVLSVLDYVSNLFSHMKFREISLHDLISGIMSKFFESNEHNPYLATNHVVFDKRLIQIQRLYSYSRKYIGMIDYYQGIMNSEPSLKRELENQACYPEDYYFASQLQKKGLKSLYWLTTHFSKFEKDVHYRSLIMKFNIQYAIEKAASNALSRFLEGMGKPRPLKLMFDPENLEIKIDSVSYDLLWGGHSNILLQHKYGFCKDFDSFHALVMNDHQCVSIDSAPHTDNQVQLFSRMKKHDSEHLDQEMMAQMSTQPNLSDREFYHLRRSKPLQIRLTLDYFIRHIEKLSDAHCQIYLEANLFEPGLLLAELVQGGEILSLLDQLIEVGLHHESSQVRRWNVSIFFIRLNYLITRYATEYSLELAYPRCKHIEQDILSLLQGCMSHEVSFLYSLYQYLFLTTMMRYRFAYREICGQELQDYLKLLLPSYFYIHAKHHQDLSLDTSTQVEIDVVKEEFKKLLLRNRFEWIQPWIGPSMEVIGLGFCESIVQKLPNHYQVKMGDGKSFKIYDVNVELGRVYHSNGMSFSVLPLDILNHPVMNFLKITRFEPCLMSSDGLMFELGESEVRFIKQKKDSLYRVQKKWEVNHVTQWYELHALSYHQKVDYELDVDVLHLFSDKIFNQRDTQIWINIEEVKNLLITQNHRPAYRTIEHLTDTQWMHLDEQARDTGILLCWNPKEIHAQLTSFESSTFTIMHQRDTSIQIQFPRYGLNLSGQKKARHWIFNREDQPDQILLNENVLRIPDVAGLVFENSKTHQRECYIPLQRLIALDEPSLRSEFYKSEHDVEAKILHTTIHQTMSNAWIWQYSNTEVLLRYTLDEDGYPVAETPREALYLAYLYLGTHHPRKAWHILEECTKRLGGLQGTLEELSLIHWILHAIPFRLNKKIIDTCIKTPEYVACQLKALALLVGYLTPGKIFEFPSPKSHSKSRNDLYQRYNLKVLKQFYVDLNKNLYALYVDYLYRHTYLDQEFQLNDAEKKCLLDFYHRQLPGQDKKALGALGYEWYVLELKRLKREQSTFNVERKIKGVLPIAYENRLKQIDDFLKQEACVSAFVTELEYLPIDLTVPKDKLIDFFSLQERAHYTHASWWYDINTVPTSGPLFERAIKALNPSITKEILQEFFPIYVSFIKAPQQEEYKILMHFCRQFLIANRHVSIEKQDNQAYIFIYILYRMLSHPSVFCDESGHFKEMECSKLIREAQSLPQPDIHIYQMKTKTDQLLATRAHIWSTLRDEAFHSTIRIKPLYPFSMDSYSPKAMIAGTSLDPLVKQRFMDCIEKYQSLSHQFHHILSTPASHDPSHRVLNPREIEAGAQKGRAFDAIKQIAEEMFSNESIRRLLRRSAFALIKKLQIEKKHQWQAILAFIEEGSVDPIKKRQRQFDLDNGQRVRPNEQRLLSLYCRANRNIYMQETGLDEAKIDQLHTFLTHYLCIATQLQQWRRFCRFLDDVAVQAQKPNFQVILACLLAENLVDVDSEPELVLFQFYENLLLYPEQIDVCRRLIKSPQSDPSSFVETIEKIPMGGGKSKVILPLLARIKAMGSNLVVIEVPRALLKTNFVDLSHTSSRLFGQKAHLLEFNRDSHCSIENLEWIHSTLLNVIVNQDYIVTNGETIRSLRLKYLELLLVYPQDETQQSIWMRQVRSLDQIIHLLKTRTDALIDEPHQGLLPKRVLNYSIGESRSLSTELISECVELFLFFDHISLKGIFDDKYLGRTFASLFLTEETLLKSKDTLWVTIKEQLAQCFVDRVDSPLQRICRQMGLTLTARVKDQLICYLLEKIDDIPDFILESDLKFREFFALYKGQISILPETLSRQLNVDYGASKLPIQAPSLAALAIPYVANNAPVEKSRFGNELVSVNLTIQMLMLNGLTPALFYQYLCRLQIQAKQELDKYPMYGKLEDTPTARGLRNLAPELTIPFNQINEKDELQFKSIFSMLRTHKLIIADVLKNDVLPHITMESEFLHSNAYHHVDSYRSCQGLTGTPGPMGFYHHRFNQIEQQSTAMDGFIYYLLQEKKTQIRCVQKQKVTLFLKNLFSTKTSNDHVRAIIDVCAVFKGMSHERVARDIADFIKTHSELFSLPEPLKYVIFFNEDNVLCALDIYRDNRLIVIGSTDPHRLEMRLGCTANQRFTYYDQSHAEGIDINHAKTAQAMILVNDDTCLQNYFQGCLRMREFHQDQSIEIIMTQGDTTLSLDELCAKMDENQKRTLSDKLFMAGQAKMINLIRSDLERRILTIPNDEVQRKHQYALAFRKYFVETSQTSLFDKYGQITLASKVEDIFSQQQRFLLEDWSNLLTKVGEKAHDLEIKEVFGGLDAIMKDALKICKGSLQKLAAHALDTEVENQKQLQVEVCREAQLEQERFEPHRVPIVHETWSECPLSAEESKYFGILSLSELCLLASPSYVPDFGSVFVTRNYYQTYEGQVQFLGSYLKPVHAILFQQKDDGCLEAFILSQQEADDLVYMLKKNPKPNLWITTTNHTYLAGIPAIHCQENTMYLDMIESIRFFNGELTHLLDGKTPLNWLSQDIEKKCRFFEKYLMLARETKFQDLVMIRESLSQRQKAFYYIQEHPLKDYTDFDWRNVISPALTDADIEECSHLAQAFTKANQDWQTEGMNWKTCQRGLKLSMQASMYFSNYFEANLLPLKEVFPSFEEDDLGKQFKEIAKKYFPSLIHQFIPLHRTKQRTLLQFLLVLASQVSEVQEILELVSWVIEKKGDLHAWDREGPLAFEWVLEEGGDYKIRVVQWLVEQHVPLPSKKESWHKISHAECLEWLQSSTFKYHEPFLLACLDVFQQDEATFLNQVHRLQFTDRIMGDILKCLAQFELKNPIEQYIFLFHKMSVHIETNLTLFEDILNLILRFDSSTRELMLLQMIRIPWSLIHPKLFNALIQETSDHLRITILYSYSFQDRLKQDSDLLKSLFSCAQERTMVIKWIRFVSFKKGLHRDVISFLMDESHDRGLLNEIFINLYEQCDELHLKQIVGVYTKKEIKSPNPSEIKLLQQVMRHPNAGSCFLQELVDYGLGIKVEIMNEFWKNLSYATWDIIDIKWLRKMFVCFPLDIISYYFHSHTFQCHHEKIITQIIDLHDLALCSKLFPYLFNMKYMTLHEKYLITLLQHFPRHFDEAPSQELIDLINKVVHQVWVGGNVLNELFCYALNYNPHILNDFWEQVEPDTWMQLSSDTLCKMILKLPEMYLNHFLSSGIYQQYSDVMISRIINTQDPAVLNYLIQKKEFQLKSTHLLLLIKRIDELGIPSLCLTMIDHPSVNELVLLSIIQKISIPMDELHHRLMSVDTYKMNPIYQCMFMEKARNQQHLREANVGLPSCIGLFSEQPKPQTDITKDKTFDNFI